MPKALERKLKAEAKKKGFTGKRANAYVYGTLRKTGWTPKRKKGRVRSMRKGGIITKTKQLALLHKGEQVMPAGGLGAEINMREMRRLGIVQNARGPRMRKRG
mgnify:CR=1 FL=1